MAYNPYQQYNAQGNQGYARGGGQKKQYVNDPLKPSAKLTMYTPKDYRPGVKYPDFSGIIGIDPALINALMQAGVNPKYNSYPVRIALWHNPQDNSFRIVLSQPGQPQNQASPPGQAPYVQAQQQYAPPPPTMQAPANYQQQGMYQGPPVDTQYVQQQQPVRQVTPQFTPQVQDNYDDIPF